MKEAIKTQDVAALLLPPTARVRYVMKDKNRKVWTIEEAATKANLLFAAWDQSDHREKSTVTVNLPLCANGMCGRMNSLSSDVARHFPLLMNCNNKPIVSELGFLVKDDCGVCGGNSSSCADCENVPNGGTHKNIQYIFFAPKQR